MSIRTQLSLYVPRSVADPLEAIRRVLDPVQAGLIPAHVTLCREDEIAGLDRVTLKSRLGAAEARPVVLRFGSAEAFQGHGILLPCVEGEQEFQALRRWILGSGTVRRQVPHITLAHPRNPKAPNNTLAGANAIADGLIVTFTTVRLIEQQGSAAWKVLSRFELGGTVCSDEEASPPS